MIYQSDTENFCRNLRLAEFFHDKDDKDKSIAGPKSYFNPPNGRNEFLDTATTVLKHIPPPTAKKMPTYNVSRDERHALKYLASNNNIIIKEADKGAAIVIMNTDYYIEKVQQIIDVTDSYEKLTNNYDRKLMKDIEGLTCEHTNELTEKEIRFLTKFDFKTSNFYGLPKVHKSEEIGQAIEEQQTEVVTVRSPKDLKLRPIIAGPTCPTHRLSHFIDLILQPLLKNVKAYIKHDFDLLTRLPHELKNGTIIATFDVEKSLRFHHTSSWTGGSKVLAE